MLDLTVPRPAESTATAPHPNASALQNAAMDEPGIFKGCRGVDGPLPRGTKTAILTYLAKPNDPAWQRLREHAITGATTLGDAWALANPGATQRFPTSAELIRAMRFAVVAQWRKDSPCVKPKSGRPMKTWIGH